MKGVARVRVGSLNAAKLAAVSRGLSAFYDELRVEPVSTESGVSTQPLGFEEIVTGARNRARASYAPQDCDFAVGLEDGLIPVEGTETGYVNMGCCLIFDGALESLGFSAGFEYPTACVEAAIGPQRVPVGGSFDALFSAPEGWTDPGRGAGNIGRLTGGALTRTDYAAQAVTCAFVRLLHPKLYGGRG